MIDTLSFVNSHWFWQIVLAALLLWLVFAWKEWQQVNKYKLYLKLVLALIAITSLALIILKPLVVSNLTNYDVVLLTKDYNLERLDSLKKAKKKIQVQNYKINEVFINPNKIPSSIYILGEGIAPFDFYQMDSLNVSYLGTHSPSGIVKLNFEQEQVVGNHITIDGLYANAEKGKRLVLESPAKTSLDSVVFSTDSTQTFKLSTQLNIIGNYEYNIVEKDSLGSIISSNPIGVRVNSENTLSILIINGFPTFETKYLKNYLAEKGHEVGVRSQVTRGKFKYEYFNKTTKPPVDFSEKSLQNYDLVIIDSQSFRSLGENQQANLESFVRNEGLGVFIQSNASFNNSVTYLIDFSFQSDKSTIANLAKWPKTNISKLPYSFKPTFALQPINQVNTSILTAYKSLGNGRIGTSVFENTFQLILNGNTNIYQTLWSETINALSKKNIHLATWDAESNIIFKDEPFHFNIRSDIHNPKVIDAKNNPIPLINDINNSSLWKGRTYPTKNGWNSQRLEQDSMLVFNYHVTDSSHWQPLKSQNTISANKKQFDFKQQRDKPYTTKLTMTLIWLYIIFLLCIGYLWIEPKL